MTNMPVLSGTMKSRSEMYAFLSRLFLDEVDENLIESLRRTPLPPMTGNHNIDEGYRLIFRASDKQKTEAREAFAVDYSRTFIGTGADGGSAAYPYESVYTSERHLLMQDAFHEVIKEYRESGYNKSQRSEPEDHIGIELEFMGILCEKTKEAFERNDEKEAELLVAKQKRFLQNHITNWVIPFANDMATFSQTDLYRGLALLTREFITRDKEFLASLDKSE